MVWDIILEKKNNEHQIKGSHEQATSSKKLYTRKKYVKTVPRNMWIRDQGSAFERPRYGNATIVIDSSMLSPSILICYGTITMKNGLVGDL